MPGFVRYGHNLLIIHSLHMPFNRLYVVDANSHHTCAASETQLTRIRNKGRKGQ